MPRISENCELLLKFLMLMFKIRRWRQVSLLVSLSCQCQIRVTLNALGCHSHCHMNEISSTSSRPSPLSFQLNRPRSSSVPPSGCFIVQVEANERRREKSLLVSKMLVKHLKVFPTRWSTKSLSDLVNRVWNRAQPSHVGHYRSTLR